MLTFYQIWLGRLSLSGAARKTVVHLDGASANWFIASNISLAQDVGFSEIAFALRNSRDGFTLGIENGACRARPVILFDVCCHADELVTALNEDRGRPTRFLLD